MVDCLKSFCNFAKLFKGSFEKALSDFVCCDCANNPFFFVSDDSSLCPWLCMFCSSNNNWCIGFSFWLACSSDEYCFCSPCLCASKYKQKRLASFPSEIKGDSSEIEVKAYSEGNIYVTDIKHCICGIPTYTESTGLTILSKEENYSYTRSILEEKIDYNLKNTDSCISLLIADYTLPKRMVIY